MQQWMDSLLPWASWDRIFHEYEAYDFMKTKLIVTRLMRNQREYTVCAFYQDNRMLEVTAQPQEENSILGNIYVGRVKDVVPSLNAAFIEIAPGVPCYFSMEDLKNPVFVKKVNSPRLVKGDELLVQVEKESMKTKPPRVTTNLSFTGKYLVLTTGNRTLGISKKLNGDVRERLRRLLETEGVLSGRNDILPLPDSKAQQTTPSPYGILARTNSAAASEEEILSELALLKQQAESLIDKAPYQTCFSCVRKQRPEYLTALQNAYTDQLDEIVTDEPELYDEMQQYLQDYQPIDLPKLRFYEDKLLPLAKCMSLDVKLEEALQERVWLKSGGYLIIQPTEALTVIDVNSGKSAAKGDVQKHYLKVNLEAAAEAAAQLRLRNISGIIIIDFIDMASQEAREQLLEALRIHTGKDPVPVQVVDMTKLNLVELTRKKVRKSLREQFII